MYIIARGRKQSKTTELIERAAEAESRGQVCYIVCHSRDEAERVFRKAQEMGKRIGFPITYEEFLNKRYAARNIHHFLIDNADYLLQSMTPVDIDTIVVNT